MPATSEGNGTLTQLEWTDDDFETGERIARSLGFEPVHGETERENLRTIAARIEAGYFVREVAAA